MKIGSHVSNNGTKMLLGSVEEALSYNANCFMVYMGAPQNTFRKPIASMNIKEMHQVLMINDISLNDVIVHAPYIVNLGQIDDNKFNYAIDFLTNEVLPHLSSPTKQIFNVNSSDILILLFYI